jgi:hypothetical protein
MLAPTREVAAGLNARARADRLAATVRPGAGGQGPAGQEVRLADGSAASAGDTVITRRNNRRLAISATDWVKNGDRWTVEQVRHDGALQVQHPATGRRLVLPAEYTREHVALGYASTVHAAQGSTAEVCHTVATGAESRQLLYVAMTRGKASNHLYLSTASDGNEHDVITPDALRPPTAVDLLARIVARDGSQISATTAQRDLAAPVQRLADTADRYHDSLGVAAETLLGPDRLAELDAAAERALSGLSRSAAYPTLRSHLALLALDGHDPETTLAGAISRRDLTDARDPAAALDWRLDPTAGTAPPRRAGRCRGCRQSRTRWPLTLTGVATCRAGPPTPQTLPTASAARPARGHRPALRSGQARCWTPTPNSSRTSPSGAPANASTTTTLG